MIHKPNGEIEQYPTYIIKKILSMKKSRFVWSKNTFDFELIYIRQWRSQGLQLGNCLMLKNLDTCSYSKTHQILAFSMIISF